MPGVEQADIVLGQVSTFGGRDTFDEGHGQVVNGNHFRSLRTRTPSETPSCIGAVQMAKTPKTKRRPRKMEARMKFVSCDAVRMHREEFHAMPSCRRASVDGYGGPQWTNDTADGNSRRLGIRLNGDCQSDNRVRREDADKRHLQIVRLATVRSSSLGHRAADAQVMGKRDVGQKGPDRQ